MTAQPLNPPFPPDSLYAALSVIVRDPRLRQMLEQAAPMAIEQADTALSLNPERPGDRADCRRCGRSIILVEGRWVDPQATDDDVIWRETCDENNEDRIAAHEPAIKAKPTVVIVEVPQDDPYSVVLNDEEAVEIIEHSEFPFSRYASDEDTYNAAESLLGLLKSTEPGPYWDWLRNWLGEQIERSEREFVVDWEDFAVLTKCSECGEGHDEEKGDGYCGQCPECADKAVLLDHLRDEHGVDLQDTTIDRSEGHKAEHRDRDDLDHAVDDV